MNTAAWPAVVVSNGYSRNSQLLLIRSAVLAPVLAAFLNAGINVVNVVVIAAGIAAQGRARIYKKDGKYALYPLNELRKFLLEIYLRNRATAPKGARRPLPVAVLQITPAAQEKTESKSAVKAGEP